MRQQLLWVPGSPSIVDVDFDERPFRVWTVYSHMDQQTPPTLPLTPKHNEGFFLEDHTHDWIMLGPRKFRYFSRVVGREDGVWLLLEWKESS